MLRFSKGRGFKEIIYTGVRDTTYSEYFLRKTRQCLLEFDSDVSKEFMNAVFNALNDVTSELFMILKELKQAQAVGKQQLLRRIKYYLDMIIDLCRIVEMLTKWIPELFLSKDQIHASRLLDYVQFVFRSIFRMKMDEMFVDFCSKL